MKRMLIEEIEKLDRNFLTPAEAAAAMEISLSTFYRNREKMNLPTVRSGRKIHIPKDAYNVCTERASQVSQTSCIKAFANSRKISSFL